jgi:prophage antirepressor-like protein
MLFVTESGLYTLIIRSNKSVARKFRKWITSEVLPSIRRTGFYKTDRRELKSVTVDADVKRMLAVIDSFLMVGDKKKRS